MQSYNRENIVVPAPLSSFKIFEMEAAMSFKNVNYQFDRIALVNRKTLIQLLKKKMRNCLTGRYILKYSKH